MKFSFVSALLATVLFQNAWAGLYSCKESTGEPIYVPANKATEVAYESVDATFLTFHSSDELYKNRKPFLIYYAVDSTEAFMQYSVRFEIAKLQESCLKSNNVNFAALINSLYVNQNEIIICKNQELNYLRLDDYPALNNSLKLKREFISTGDHFETELGPLTYLVRYLKHTNEAFGKYPLAHPDFLYDLIKFVTTDENLFPNDKYLPFLNLKSHGSDNRVLAGMHQCQEKAKEKTANLAINSLLNEDEILYLVENSLESKTTLDIQKYDEILSKLHLGSDQGINVINEEDLGETKLGESKLNFHKNGLGNLIQGLGVSQGLGLQYSFGTAHPQLTWVLSDLFENESDRLLGFLMLESCDTKRDPELFHSYIYNVLGYYSAKHSLWYRNLNWWTILEKAENSSVNLLKILKEETSKIPNIKVTSP